MAHPPRRNDPRGRRGERPHRPQASPGEGWLWGWHAVLAALENPQRAVLDRLLATPDRAAALAERGRGRIVPEVVDGPALDRALGRAVAHQGVALKAGEPPPLTLDELGARPHGVLLALDQLTDPQNVGAVFRSAAAFGARGIVLQDRHAPPLAGSLAKAAVGAIERVAHARVVNLARALERLESLGWRTVGLDAGGEKSLAQTLDGGPTVLVLGSEDDGLRRLVREHCDVLARIPMTGGFESLNVSAAAAIALYLAQQAHAVGG